METHASWQAIVRDGERNADGMPSFDLSEEDIENIRLYVLSLSAALRAAANE
jgi:mono/diheme cytochrome c family protein